MSSKVISQLESSSIYTWFRMVAVWLT